MSDSIYASKEVCASISATNPSYCSFCTAAGQVMICYNNSNEWTLQGSGYIDLSINQNQNLYINLYSSENYQIIYQFQLYPNFSKHYKKLSETFYKFETNEDYLIGLSFSSAEEAKNFETAVINQSKRVKKKLFTKPQKESKSPQSSSTIITTGIESPLQNSLEARGLSKDDISSGKIDTATLMEIISEADNHVSQKSSSESLIFNTPQKPTRNLITDKISFYNSFDVDKRNNIISTEIKTKNDNDNDNDNENKNDNDNDNENKNENEEVKNEETNKEDENNNQTTEDQIKLSQVENDSTNISEITQSNDVNKSDGEINKSPNANAAKNFRAQRGRANSAVVFKGGQFFINELQVKPPPKVKPPPPDTPPPVTARRIPKIDLSKTRSGQLFPSPVRQSPLATEKNDENVS